MRTLIDVTPDGTVHVHVPIDVKVRTVLAPFVEEVGAHAAASALDAHKPFESRAKRSNSKGPHP
jgi:hypothetical protein